MPFHKVKLVILGMILNIKIVKTLLDLRKCVTFAMKTKYKTMNMNAPNIIKTIFFFILLSSLFACNQSAQNVTVNGQINGMGNTMVFLSELTPEELVLIDSVSSNTTGGFTLGFTSKETSFYILELPLRQIPLIMGPGESVKIFGDTATLDYFYGIDGPIECQILNDFENVTRKNEKAIDSLAKIFEQSQNSTGFDKMVMKLNAAYDSIFAIQVDYVKAMVSGNPDKLASLLIITQPFGPRRVINEENDYDLIKKIDEGVMSAYPNNVHAIENHKRFLQLEKELAEAQEILESLSPGNPAPDFSLPKLNGDSFSLSSLKGNTVLLYIWGALDAKSRNTNKQLRELYTEYNNNGFEIVGVSIDLEKDPVERAIIEDKAEWINLCDFKSNQTPVLSLYRIPEVLPYFILIDKEGTILYRGKNLALVKEELRKEF